MASNLEPRLRTNRHGKEYYELQVTEHGKRYTFTAKDKTTCINKYVEFKTSGRDVFERYTLTMAVEEWIPRRKVKKTTLAHYYVIFDRYIKPFSDKFVLNADTFDPVKLDKFLLKEYFGKSHSTQKLIRFIVKSSMKYAINRKKMPPCDLGELQPLKDDKERKRYEYDQSFNEKVLELIALNNKYSYSIKLLFLTGIRLGEALGLEPGDVCDGFFNISRTYSLMSGHGYVTQSPKSKNSIRKLPLPKELSDLKENLPLGVRPNSLEVYFKKATGFVIHDLRHNYASNLVRNGFDVATIAELLGDTRETVVNVYLHGNLQGRIAAVEAIGKILMG